MYSRARRQVAAETLLRARRHARSSAWRRRRSSEPSSSSTQPVSSASSAGVERGRSGRPVARAPLRRRPRSLARPAGARRAAAPAARCARRASRHSSDPAAAARRPPRAGRADGAARPRSSPCWRAASRAARTSGSSTGARAPTPTKSVGCAASRSRQAPVVREERLRGREEARHPRPRPRSLSRTSSRASSRRAFEQQRIVGDDERVAARRSRAACRAGSPSPSSIHSIPSKLPSVRSIVEVLVAPAPRPARSRAPRRAAQSVSSIITSQSGSSVNSESTVCERWLKTSNSRSETTSSSSNSIRTGLRCPKLYTSTMPPRRLKSPYSPTSGCGW